VPYNILLSLDTPRGTYVLWLIRVNKHVLKNNLKKLFKEKVVFILIQAFFNSKRKYFFILIKVFFKENVSDSQISHCADDSLDIARQVSTSLLQFLVTS